METEDIARLATLSRIRLSAAEMEDLKTDIASVLSYVQAIDDIAADSALTKKVGARYNVFREDAVTNEADSYTDALLREAPDTQGRFLKVKKILDQE